MNTEQERYEFESRFPAPVGVGRKVKDGQTFYYGDAADDTLEDAAEYQRMWDVWQARAKRSGCTQSELDELYQILNGTPHMEQVTPKVFKLALDRHMREFQARAAECRGLEGWLIRKVDDHITVQHPDIGGYCASEEGKDESAIAPVILFHLADALLQSAPQPEQAMQTGKLRIMGDIELGNDDGPYGYKCALLIQFPTEESIRQAIADGCCSFKWGE